MMKSLPFVQRIESDPVTFLSEHGEIFVVFDERTQDSGNVSYGVEVDGRRYFVKTAGRPDDDMSYLDHSGRVGLLRNAVKLAESSDHRTLPQFHQVVESSSGPMLIYDWVEGENVRNCLDRVRSLAVSEVTQLVTEVYDLHCELTRLGWIANDFYDGAMIYDFRSGRLHVIDLDSYNTGSFANSMGRMAGSSRFMAPEEFALGATIDERTTVFTMGRTAAVLMSDNSLERVPFLGTDGQYEVMLRCCAEDPDERFQTVAEMCAAWVEAQD